MRLSTFAQIALPLLLVVSGGLLMMDRMDLVRIDSLIRLWPVTLIAVGLEDLYRWSTKGKTERER